MSLFRNLGEKVERFKQQAQQVSEDKAAYECADCGNVIYIDRGNCPECGSENLLARKTADEQSGSAEQQTGSAEQQSANTGQEGETAERQSQTADEQSEAGEQ